MNEIVVAVLRCPRCAGDFRQEPPDGLTCARCGQSVAVEQGIPRFVPAPADDLARRTQASFGYEWTQFNDWQQSGEVNFNDYFQGLDLAALGGRLVLDAGCGMGRHARQLAPFVGHIVATDFSSAIVQAAKNTAGYLNVDCIQADLFALPVADECFDFIYSLGVLHHVSRTEEALRVLVSKLKPGGRLRIYLYWKRHGWQGRLLQLVSLARRLTVSLPFGLLKTGCFVLSIGLYAFVILPYRGLSAAGLHQHEGWPLFVYTKYPFNVLYNDQFDRFSAPIEKRYDAKEVADMLAAAGLHKVEVRACFGWIADGIKP